MTTPSFNISAAHVITSAGHRTALKSHGSADVTDEDDGFATTVMGTALTVIASLVLVAGLIIAVSSQLDLDVKQGSPANAEGRSAYNGRRLSTPNDATMYDFGWASYCAGVPANANPYERSYSRSLWLSGWIDAKRSR